MTYSKKISQKLRKLASLIAAGYDDSYHLKYRERAIKYAANKIENLEDEIVSIRGDNQYILKSMLPKMLRNHYHEKTEINPDYQYESYSYGQDITVTMIKAADLLEKLKNEKAMLSSEKETTI